MTGNPNQVDFEKMVRSGMLDCNNIVKDCENANHLQKTPSNYNQGNSKEKTKMS